MIERVRISLGGYFQSAEILEINILVQRDILKNNKWNKPVPALKGSSYEVLQIFNRRFCYETKKLLTSLQKWLQRYLISQYLLYLLYALL
jgi:hypothetical protein